MSRRLTTIEYLNSSSSPDGGDGKDKFYGICIDIDASYRSVASCDQYLALSKFQDLKIDISTTGNVHATFDEGSASSIGYVQIKTSFGVFKFHIFYANTPCRPPFMTWIKMASHSTILEIRSYNQLQA